MEWVETTGKTLDEAKDKALDELGVDEGDAEFELLEEPKQGLFGRVRSEARVRARVKPRAPRAKAPRRDKRKRGSADGSAASADVAGAPDESDSGGESREARGPRRRRGRRSTSRDTEGARSGSDREEKMEEVPLTEQSEVAEDFLAGLIDELDLDAQISTRSIDEETYEVALQGDGLGTLIGPKGETLDALQDLMRTVVHRRTRAGNGRLLLDVGGYRAKRRSALERFAKEVAERVLTSGSAVALEPMSPADRKVVHDTINEIDGVSTTSEGEDNRRRVVISPS